MEEVKIGKLIFNRTAILLLALCLFLNGIIIGVYAVIGIKDNFMLFYMLIFMPYLFLLNSIRRNIKEVK